MFLAGMGGKNEAQSDGLSKSIKLYWVLRERCRWWYQRRQAQDTEGSPKERERVRRGHRCEGLRRWSVPFQAQAGGREHGARTADGICC
jgi:hypothetical protein